MSQIRLTHLTFIGATVEPARVVFGPAVTLVRGPSDTGKSFIVDALDFMMGANALKEIPERQNYSTVLLGVQMPDERLVTLTRSVDGGNFGLYRSDIRSGPLAPPDETLTPKHNVASETNISRFFLACIGLDGRRVRKNLRNATDSLSFRNVVNLCVVDETQMQADTPPALTGNYVTRTKEVSVLKMFLQDSDDSDLVEVESKSDVAKVSAAKIEVIDRMLANLEAALADAPEAAILRDQLARLNSTIEQQSASIGGLLERRATVNSELRSQQDQFSKLEVEWGDTFALQNRFALLHRKYLSDLARLDTVREAGNLLGYFTVGTCVFCGAEAENQHYNTDCNGEATNFGSAIDEQSRRTRALSDDLQSTMDDLVVRRRELKELARLSSAEQSRLRSRLADDERTLAGDNSALNEYIRKRSDVERSLGLYDQIESLEKMKLVVLDESTAETAAVSTSVSLRAQREFSRELVDRLKSWGYPKPTEVRYDASVQDIIAGDQMRSAHGKGVRAILHGAFTLALAKYCSDRVIAHPGFVVLDSPLVTYRPPDQPQVDVGEPPRDVVAAFYRDLQHNSTGQVIVMENTDPPEALDDQTMDIVFTASETGRYGFFPVP